MDIQRRRSCRFPVLPQQQRGLVRIGRVDLPVILENESMGGFLLAMPPEARLYVGRRLLLLARGIWFEVRVVHFHCEGDVLHVGVERLAEREDDAASSLMGRLWGRAPGPQLERRRTRGLMPVALTALVLAGIWGWGEAQRTGRIAQLLAHPWMQTVRDAVDTVWPKDSIAIPEDPASGERQEAFAAAPSRPPADRKRTAP